VRDSEIPDKYKFLPNVDSILSMGKIKNSASFDTVLVLECPQADRIGAAARYLETADTVINIDHHPGNTLKAQLSWVDTSRSSVGEMAYDYFETVGHSVDTDTAIQLYTAIMTDTGRFRFESTTPRALEVVAKLVTAGADPRHICDRVYFDQDPTVLSLTGKVLSTAEYHDAGRICFLTLTKQMLKETGANLINTEGLVDYSLYVRGVRAGALLREIDSDNTKISLRSRNGYDISRVAAEFNGGGHPNAAGCRIAQPIAAAKQTLIDLLRRNA
jgi:phosphoesterase RecJ-like protein